MAVQQKTTVIEGELIYDTDRSGGSGGGYNLLLFVREQTTNATINIRYQGNIETNREYYLNCHRAFRDRTRNRNVQLQLTIRGSLEEGKMEYEGTGLIKLLS